MQIDENKNSTDVEHVQSDSGTNGEEQTDSKKSHHVIAKVLCALAAVVLWFYVVAMDTAIEEKRFTDVSVEIRGLEVLEEATGLSLISGDDQSIDITLSGTKAAIDRLTGDSLIVYADVSKINEWGDYSLKIETSLPNGVNVTSKSANFIDVYVDKRDSVLVDIAVEITVEQMDASSIVGTPKPAVATVRVEGPAAALGNISHAMVEVKLSKDSKSTTTDKELVLIDKNGDVIDNPYLSYKKEIRVTVPVYTYKDVVLDIQYKYGYYNDSNVRISMDPAVIRVKGEHHVLDELDSIVILIDEKEKLDKPNKTVAITLPEGVENVSGRSTAEITVNHIGTKTAEIVTPISVINEKRFEYELESTEIAVLFRGTPIRLGLLSENNVVATVDLNALDGTPGTFSVPVTITVPSTHTGTVYEVGEYSVNVTIK